jgi:hypothetical protein
MEYELLVAKVVGFPEKPQNYANMEKVDSKG